jgi:hypothetical protein
MIIYNKGDYEMDKLRGNSVNTIVMDEHGFVDIDLLTNLPQEFNYGREREELEEHRREEYEAGEL